MLSTAGEDSPMNTTAAADADHAGIMPTPSVTAGGTAPEEAAPAQPAGLFTFGEVEDEGVLRSFRSDNLPLFPLMYIPTSTTAKDLKGRSPFTWLCIATVQCKDMARRGRMSSRLREIAAKLLLADCQKSLDLLQGVLIFVAW